MDTIIIPHTGCELTKNIIPLVYIKKILFMIKNFLKTQVIWIKRLHLHVSQNAQIIISPMSANLCNPEMKG